MWGSSGWTRMLYYISYIPFMRGHFWASGSVWRAKTSETCSHCFFFYFFYCLRWGWWLMSSILALNIHPSFISFISQVRNTVVLANKYVPSIGGCHSSTGVGDWWQIWKLNQESDKKRIGLWFDNLRAPNIGILSEPAAKGKSKNRKQVKIMKFSQYGWICWSFWDLP